MLGAEMARALNHMATSANRMQLRILFIIDFLIIDLFVDGMGSPASCGGLTSNLIVNISKWDVSVTPGTRKIGLFYLTSDFSPHNAEKIINTEGLFIRQ